MSHSAAVSQKIESEASYNPFTSSEQADESDFDDSMYTSEPSKIDVKEALKGLFKLYHDCGFIKPSVTEEEFCGLTLENLTLNCIKFGLSEVFEKHLLAIISGNMLKRTDEESLIEVPLKDNGYYFKANALKQLNLKLMITKNRQNVLLLMNEDGIYRRIQTTEFKQMNTKKVIRKFVDNNFIVKPITYAQLKALTGPIEPRPEGYKGLAFDEKTKTWSWLVHNDNFLKAMLPLENVKEIVNFTNLYFAKASGAPYELIDGKYIECVETDGKISLTCKVCQKFNGKPSKQYKICIKNFALKVLKEHVYKKTLDAVEKDAYEDLQ